MFDHIKCPKCGNELPSGSMWCYKCDYRFPSQQNSQDSQSALSSAPAGGSEWSSLNQYGEVPASMEPASANIKFCRQCGARLMSREQVCYQCGTRADSPENRGNQVQSSIPGSFEQNRSGDIYNLSDNHKISSYRGSLKIPRKRLRFDHKNTIEPKTTGVQDAI